jgi:hypothetical protein
VVLDQSWFYGPDVVGKAATSITTDISGTGVSKNAAPTRHKHVGVGRFFDMALGSRGG